MWQTWEQALAHSGKTGVLSLGTGTQWEDRHSELGHWHTVGRQVLAQSGKPDVLSLGTSSRKDQALVST